MFKIRYIDDHTTSNILEKESTYEKVNDSFFEGYRGIIEIKKVKENWLVPREGREPDCILANDYKFFRLFPCHKHYAILAIYDEKFRFLEFYIDVIKDVQFDEQEKLPYMQDLYLDIVYTNLDEIIVLDEEELEEALFKKEITLEDYQMVLDTKQEVISNLKDPSYIQKLK